ncbi:MAG: DUF4375 domain-containing protein [Desulfatibacillum sp.]|nr:DUF4375 domain-containing protein [Desulfatibacillum sp.]
MTEIQWFEDYTGQTTDELIALEGRYRKDSIVLAFESVLDQRADKFGPQSLSQEELVILAIEALEREVNNGGYEQFFINSSYEYSPTIVDALNRIGCSDAAAITQDAIDSLGIRGAITIEKVEQIMKEEDEGREEKLGACDDRYFDTIGDLSEPLFEFIKANKGNIKC